MRRPDSATLRFFAAAFSVDGAVNLTIVGVPYRAIDLGATSLQLGLLPAVWSIVYVLMTLQMGRLSDRFPRVTLARIGAVIVALSFGIIALTPVLSGLYVGQAVGAIGLSMFWPAIQAALAESDHPSRLRKNLGWFNLSWSSGKGIGFALGGLLLASRGLALLCAISAAVLLIVAALLRPVLGRGVGPAAAPPAGTEPEHDPDAEAPRRVRQGFLRLAWIANGTAYGVNATLGFHFPKFLQSHGIGSNHFGLFLGLSYLAQTLTFALLMRTSRWHYHRWPLYSVHLLLASILVLLPTLAAPAAQLLMAPLVGLGLGVAYYSSIYYSLNAADRPGRNTGIHEAIIGSGVLVAPPLGGALVLLTGRLVAPYLLVAGLSIAAIGAEEAVSRRFRRT